MLVTMQPSFCVAKCAMIQAHKKILPFVTQFEPTLKGLKEMAFTPRETVKESPLISHRKGKSLKGTSMLVKAKL